MSYLRQAAAGRASSTVRPALRSGSPLAARDQRLHDPHFRSSSAVGTLQLADAGSASYATEGVSPLVAQHPVVAVPRNETRTQKRGRTTEPELSQGRESQGSAPQGRESQGSAPQEARALDHRGRESRAPQGRELRPARVKAMASAPRPPPRVREAFRDNAQGRATERSLAQPERQTPAPQPRPSSPTVQAMRPEYTPSPSKPPERAASSVEKSQNARPVPPSERATETIFEALTRVDRWMQADAQQESDGQNRFSSLEPARENRQKSPGDEPSRVSLAPQLSIGTVTVEVVPPPRPAHPVAARQAAPQRPPTRDRWSGSELPFGWRQR